MLIKLQIIVHFMDGINFFLKEQKNNTVYVV